MFQSKRSPFEDDVEKATNENNLSEDWSLIMQICDNAVNYQDGAKFCFKAIMKRLHHNVPRVVIQALTLLDSCVKNCDKKFLLQVASSEFTTEVRKLLGKIHPSAAIKLKELLQKWSLEEFKDDPELCIIPALYYKLKSEGEEFPSKEKEIKPPTTICTDPNAVTSQEEENDIIKAIEISLKDTGKYAVTVEQDISGISSALKENVPEPFKVRAIYDFDAAEDNELTIKIGEIVLVLDNSNSSWWKGSNHRGEGLFPSNFVTEDLDFKPEEPKIEALPVVEAVLDNSEEEIKINEEKIDAVLNWLNDVDPTEDLSDPEDMLKLERECNKMGPLIEENLQAIDNRLAKLNLVNDKIMAAFDLFHDLSGQFSTLPANMKLYSSTMPMPCVYHTLPKVSNIQPVSSMQPGLPNTNTQETVISPASGSNPISNDEETLKPRVNLPTQTLNPRGDFSQLLASTSFTIPTTNVASTVANPSINQVMHPAAVMNPYGTNMMGGIFIPPGVPLPFPTAAQQGNYIPIPGSNQNFMSLPYPVSSMSPYMPYPYYYLNSSPAPVPFQSSELITSKCETQSVTMNTSTAVSTALSTTPLSSISSYYSDLQQIVPSDSTISSGQNSKQELLANSNIQEFGDGHLSNNSTSGSDNS